jgi:hypothetical protein
MGAVSEQVQSSKDLSRPCMGATASSCTLMNSPRSSTLIILKPHDRANRQQSSRRAIEPMGSVGLTSSHNSPAGESPARRHRSFTPSACQQCRTQPHFPVRPPSSQRTSVKTQQPIPLTDGTFRMPPTRSHSTRCILQGDQMTRSSEFLRLCLGVGQQPRGVRSVVRRDSCGNAGMEDTIGVNR